MRLDCAMLYVKDFPGMREFYGEMFRAKPVNTEWTDSRALFDVDGTRFALQAIPAEYAHDIEVACPPQARESNPVKLIFGVADVPAERTRLEAMGITMLQRPWQKPGEACDGIDPEGNVFQITRVGL